MRGKEISMEEASVLYWIPGTSGLDWIERCRLGNHPSVLKYVVIQRGGGGAISRVRVVGSGNDCP